MAHASRRHEKFDGAADLIALLVAAQAESEVETSIRRRALTEIAALSTEHLCELAFAVDQRRDGLVDVLHAATERRDKAV